MITTRTAALAAAVAALFAAPDAVGQEALGDRPQEGVVEILGEPMDELDNEVAPVWGVDAGVTFATDYHFRGIVQDTDGLLNGGIIAQPYITLGVPLVAPEDADYALSANVGIWNSFSSEQEAPDTNPEAWYESDLFAGVSFTTGDFQIFAIYTFYTSPNGSFATVQEVGGGIAYAVPIGGNDPLDDDETGFDLGLSAAIFAEIDNSAFPDPSQADDDEGIYLELGIEPSIEREIPGIRGDVALSLPVTVGLSVGDYYVDLGGDNEFFGYVSVKGQATFPLPVPPRYGAWAITPAVEGLFLGSEGLEDLNGGEDTELLGYVSVDFSF